MAGLRFGGGGSGSPRIFLAFGPDAAVVGASVRLHAGSLNLAQFRLGFDFFGSGLGLCFVFCFPRLQVTTLGQGFSGAMGVKVFGFNERFFESGVTGLGCPVEPAPHPLRIADLSLIRF